MVKRFLGLGENNKYFVDKEGYFVKSPVKEKSKYSPRKNSFFKRVKDFFSKLRKNKS